MIGSMVLLGIILVVWRPRLFRRESIYRENWGCLKVASGERPGRAASCLWNKGDGSLLGGIKPTLTDF